MLACSDEYPAGNGPDPETGIVYAVEGAGLVKIGRTVCWAKRLHAMEMGSPVDLIVRAVWPGGPRLERALHREFAEGRQHGEWFSLPRQWRSIAERVVDEVHAEMVAAIRERLASA